MKKLLLLAVTAVLMASCQITERIYLSETGMVKYQSEIDYTSLLSFAYDDNTKDSLRRLGEFPVDQTERMGNIDNLKGEADKYTQSQKNFLKSLNKTEVHTVMNDDQGIISFNTDPMDVKSFNHYFKELKNSLVQFEKENPEDAKAFSEGAFFSLLQLEYDGKRFTRKSLNKKEVKSADDEGTGGMINYKMEYHFPKAVKSVNLAGAEISADGKVVSVVVDYDDYLKNPEKYDLKVEFK